MTAWLDDPYTLALGSGRGPLFLRRADGRLLPLEVERWCAEVDAADRSVLARCRGAVIDVGCGPGRLVAALAEQGRRTLGVDVSPAAVRSTRGRGGMALCRSVFDPLPAEGRWTTALLLDGNVGIGGDPAALLTRMAEVTAPDGLLIAEADPAEVDECHEVVIDDGRSTTGPAFPWARAGRIALGRHAEKAGWVRIAEWTVTGRHFVELAQRRRRSNTSTTATTATAARQISRLRP
ncbi:methyltransferase domain-containing protein [Herbidospora galbida]|uniref:Methyltransferase domain-containing protein n=1 Tax=Herbidospora galbida TaxID=2575442 RepID=A0A4U3M7N4_9ACTN|nr:class I SAM-dependent methyltransferase [Herbidospora galbida]TKK84988.1 methyltransferase domain-containing protein [Herbidospora galbida]